MSCKCQDLHIYVYIVSDWQTYQYCTPCIILQHKYFIV